MKIRRCLGALTAFVLVTSTVAVAEPTSTPSANTDGAVLVRQNCLICHGPELIEGQRLTREQWQKTVDKMKGWGSPVKEEDKEALVIYLADKYSTDGPPVTKKYHKPIK